MTEPGTPASSPSIHYRRRWFYGLWVMLLMLAATVWLLWERPARVDHGRVELHLTLSDLPPGTVAEIWAGPEAQWVTERWSREPLGAQLTPDTAGLIVSPVLDIPIARRRWVKDYIRSRTSDLVVLRLVPLQGTPRYYGLPLATDIHQGLIGLRGRLIYKNTARWRNLPEDPGALRVL